MGEVARLDVNLFDGPLIEDPWPVYEEIRAAGRIVWNGTLQGWMVPGFDDCSEVVTDPGQRFGMVGGDPSFMLFDGHNMITQDPPEHTRLRKSLAPMFTKKAMTRWERRVGEVVDELLAPLTDDGQFALWEFTRLPVIIVAEMLGIPRERHDELRRWSQTVMTGLDVLSAGEGLAPDDERRRRAMRDALDAVKAFLNDLIDLHREDEGHDNLIAVMLQSGLMSDEEILSSAGQVMLAGYDTTAKTLGSIVVALTEHPGQRRALVDDPSRIPAAIEEVVRWAGTNHITMRKTLQETALADTGLPAGQAIYILYGAANRDPSRWAHPERFDIFRDPRSHLGFGFGPHYCIGSHLARLEARVMLERLLSRAPEFVVRDVDLGNGMIVRGPEQGYIDVRSARSR